MSTTLDDQIDHLDFPLPNGDPLPPRLGSELASWAVDADEKVRQLRQEADKLEEEKERAFAAARILLEHSSRPGRRPSWMTE